MNVTDEADADQGEGQREAQLENVIVLALIALVGALGIAIGLMAPEHTTEPSIGVLMLAFVVVVTFRARAAARRQQ